MIMVLLRNSTFLTLILVEFRLRVCLALQMQLRTTSLLAVPVFGKEGKVVAVIEMMNKRDGPFTEIDEKLCTMLAHHVSVFLRQLEPDG